MSMSISTYLFFYIYIYTYVCVCMNTSLSTYHPNINFMWNSLWSPFGSTWKCPVEASHEAWSSVRAQVTRQGTRENHRETKGKLRETVGKWRLPSGKLYITMENHFYGVYKSTITMAIFNSKLLNYQRVRHADRSEIWLSHRRYHKINRLRMTKTKIRHEELM